MPFAKLSSNQNIYYLDENPAGKPVVLLLHGLGADGNSWQLQIPDLVKAGFRVIVPDAPGFGRSIYNSGGSSITHTAKLYWELLDQLEIQSFIPVGISMGGAHALQLALDLPLRVTRLVLVNTFSRLRIANPLVLPYFATRFLMVHTLGLNAQAGYVARRIFPSPEQKELRQLFIAQISQADPRAYRASMRALARFNVHRRLKEVACPTLVVSGEKDTTVPLKNQTQMLTGLSNAQHILVPNAGHALTIDQPQVFNQLLLEFILQKPQTVTSASS